MDQLNEIPDGFNNNLVWNLEHIIVSQQVLCYRYSELEPIIDEFYIRKYGRGAKPEKRVDSAEIKLLKEYALDTIDQLIDDYRSEKFITFNAFTSATYSGLSIEDFGGMLDFLAFHEGVHLGYSTALKHVICD